MKHAATADINAAKKAAIGELHAEASTLAVAIASRKILNREISSEDQQVATFNESLAELGAIQSDYATLTHLPTVYAK